MYLVNYSRKPIPIDILSQLQLTALNFHTLGGAPSSPKDDHYREADKVCVPKLPRQ